MLSISYCVFDLSIGNVIALSVPDTTSTAEVLPTLSLADFCFPDGSEGSDFVSLVLPSRLRRAEAKGRPGTVFGLAGYHLLRNPTAARGAIQRSVLFLCSQPHLRCFQDVCTAAVFPFFESNANVADRELPRTFFHRLHETLLAALFPSPAPGGLASTKGPNSLDVGVTQSLTVVIPTSFGMPGKEGASIATPAQRRPLGSASS